MEVGSGVETIGGKYGEGMERSVDDGEMVEAGEYRGQSRS